MVTPTAQQRRALSFIAVAQLLALSLWFSASAVAPQLTDRWELSSFEQSALTLAVQLGFVVGAVVSAMTGLADVVPARRLFVLAAIAGAGVNGALVLVDSAGAAIAIRFVTGFTLAAVYPAGLKAMAGWFDRGRGMALGVLVGALTIGSALPNLIRGIGLDADGVILAASALALVAAGVMARGVSDGPHETAAQKVSLAHARSAIANRGVRLSTYGYLGHMWELYAMWTWTASFLAASAAESGDGDGFVPVATFAIIGIGGVGSWLAGRWADEHGRTRVAGGAMAISGTCALLSPLVFGAPPTVVIALFLVWGLTVVADSAQFSTMVTETADDTTRGTALTMQTAVGFLLTLVTITVVPEIADGVGWRWAFPLLAIGPALGVVAMVRLRRSPESRLIAGGRG